MGARLRRQSLNILLNGKVSLEYRKDRSKRLRNTSYWSFVQRKILRKRQSTIQPIVAHIKSRLFAISLSDLTAVNQTSRQNCQVVHRVR